MTVPLKNRISNLEKELIEKDAIIGSVNKTVTESDEILETERGNSSQS